MRRKINAIILTLLLFLTTIVILSEDIKVKANPEQSEEIDLHFIKNITINLSEIINNYPTGMLPKGRAFGTWGELNSSTYIFNLMLGLNLSPTKERITQYPDNEIDEKVEVEAKAVKINGSNLADCYISPRWNDSYLKRKAEEFNTEAKSLLTYNFSYTGLKVLRRPQIPDWLPFFLQIGTMYLYELEENHTIINSSTLLNFLIQKFEQYSQIEFDSLTQENAADVFPWFKELLENVTGDYVLIDEDPDNNPSPREDFLFPEVLLPVYPFSNSLSYPRVFYKYAVMFTQLLVLQTNASCKGIIFYDFNNDTYDMITAKDFPLPLIFINKTEGEPIYNNPGDYTIDFYINQSYNESVDSYNVIGQINGTNPDKTVIISTLYDSWWNQGTADSAVGCGILMTLAKYYKQLETEYGILPKYTLKFIAFGGEEYGYLGAKSYEARHEDEDIVAVIDLNQLGFTQNDPRLTLNLVTNKLLFRFLQLPRIAEKTQYEERTNHTADLDVSCLLLGSPSNDQAFAEKSLPILGPRETTTVGILKDTGWTLHHRDGLDHTEGDTMKYYNETDVAITSDLVYNITRYFCLNPNCRYTPNSVTYTPFDGPDEDSVNNDSVNINFTITTQLPQDCTTICALLINYMCPILYCYLNTSDYAVTPTGITADFNVTLPRWAPPGWYWLKVYLLNSTEEVGFKYHHMSNVYSAQILNNT